MKRRLIVTLAGLLALGVMSPAATGSIKNWVEFTDTHEDDKQNVEWTLAEGTVDITDKVSLYFDVEKNYSHVTDGKTFSTYWDNDFGVSYDLGKAGDWDLSAGLGYEYDTNGDNEITNSAYYPWFEASTALTDNVKLTLWGTVFYQDGNAKVDGENLHGDDWELDITFDTGKLGIFDSTTFPIYLYHNTAGGSGSNSSTYVEIEPEAFTTLYKNDAGFYLGLEYYLDAETGDRHQDAFDFSIAPRAGWSKSLENDISVFAYTSYDIVAVTYTEDAAGDDLNWSDRKEFQVVAGVKATF